MPSVGKRKNHNIGDFSKDSMYQYAQSFCEAQQNILRESQVDFAQDPVRALSFKTAQDALKSFYIENSVIGDKKVISNLIYYHDINIGKLDEENIRYIISVLGIENISLLYNLKRADLLAQNSRYHYMIDNLNREEKKLLRSKYEKI